MFHTILVALENSSADIIFKHALAMAQQHQAHLKLLHCLPLLSDSVLEPPMMTMPGLIEPSLIASPMESSQIEDVRVQQQQESENWLGVYFQEAIAQGVQSTFQVEMGDPGIVICELADEWKADLIVMGRTHHSGLTELLLGSVSNHVLHHARCSVLVIQNPDDSELS